MDRVDLPLAFIHDFGAGYPIFSIFISSWHFKLKHYELNDLLPSTVLLGHVWEGLLLLGIVIILLTLLLQLLALFLLLYAAQICHVEEKPMSLHCLAYMCVMWGDESLCTKTVPPVWPASPSLSLPGPCAALLSQHDVSPIKETHTVTVVLTKQETTRFLFSGHTYDSVNEGDELLFLFLPLDEVSLDERLQLREILLLSLPVDVLPPNKHNQIRY